VRLARGQGGLGHPAVRIQYPHRVGAPGLAQGLRHRQRLFEARIAHREVLGAIVETAELPLAAWKVYGTAAALYGAMGDHDKAADYRRRGAAVVQTLAADLDPGEALRSIFLAVFEAESARLSPMESGRLTAPRGLSGRA